MENRFENIYELEHNLYSYGCPIIIDTGILLKDRHSGSLIIQMKLHSISIKLIKAVKFKIDTFDATGKFVGCIEYQFADLNVSEGMYFGSDKAILVQNPFTRLFKIKDMIVVSDDGLIWSMENKEPLESLYIPTTLEIYFANTELVKQYRIFTNQNARYVPINDCKGIWCCSCGTWNSGGACTNCGLTKEQALSYLNIGLLQEAIQERLIKEREIETTKLREKEEKRLQRCAWLKKSKKKIIAGSIAVGIIIIMLLGFCVWRAYQNNGAKITGFTAIEISDLECEVPANWDLYQSDDGTVAHANFHDEENEVEWYLSYEEEHDDIPQYLKENYSGNYAEEFIETKVNGCEESYVREESDKDAITHQDYKVKEYFVRCKGSIFHLEYYAKPPEYYDNEQIEELIDNVSFESYTAKSDSNVETYIDTDIPDFSKFAGATLAEEKGGGYAGISGKYIIDYKRKYSYNISEEQKEKINDYCSLLKDAGYSNTKGDNNSWWVFNGSGTSYEMVVITCKEASTGYTLEIFMGE